MTLNPIQSFESALVKIWTSPEAPAEKAKKFQGVGTAIQNYIGRVKENEMKSEDLFKARARERAISYLESLASECRFLAFVCTEDKQAVKS